MWTDILYGFQVATTPMNLLFCFLGVFLGTLMGVLPGIGPAGAMAILLPISLQITPVGSIIMLAGIYYGSMYGGSTTSILVCIPGEPASVMTCVDGYQMALKGKAGPALGIAAIGSFIAGTFSVVGLMFLAGPLATAALRFGPPEFFSLVLMGLTLATYLSQKAPEKAFMSALIGLLLSWVGIDLVNGTSRFTFGLLELSDGLGVIPLVMGLFGISEVLLELEKNVCVSINRTKIGSLLPNREEWRQSAWPIARGSVLGFFLGILPGGGGIIANFMSYIMEKRLSKHPEKFGSGEIAAVAGPEAANNAAAGGALIPLLTLGIPMNATVALLFAALMIHGVRPGPMLIAEHPEVFWGIVASMYIGNVMLLILNLPLIGIWVKVLKIPYRIIFPMIVIFCIIGVYAINRSILDLALMLGFGVLGYLMRKFDFDPAPLCLAFILGPLLEVAMRQALLLSQGNFAIFLTRPLSAICLGIAVVLLLANLISFRKSKTEKAGEHV
ncbi:MAG: tripartite tricarboxylate transporter permease [Deltaproteobacteria bacterium]